MGSVSALMYSSRDPSILCCIYDSPFSNLMELSKELVKNKIGVPKFVTAGIL